MGRSSSKKSFKPKPPPKPPEAVNVEFVKPIVQERMAMRQGRRAGYITRGQGLGSGGARLGSGSSMKADIADRMGVDDTSRAGTIGEFKGQKTYKGKRKYGFFGSRKKRNTAQYSAFLSARKRQALNTGKIKELGEK